MSDATIRKLEQELRRAGRLGEFLLAAAGELEKGADRKLIAQLTDRLSSKLTVPDGDLVVLQASVTAMPMETVRSRVASPRYEGGGTDLLCYRVVLHSDTGPVRWHVRSPEGGGMQAMDWPGGLFTVPLAEDPFRIRQATMTEFVLENLGTEIAHVGLGLWCRTIPSEQAEQVRLEQLEQIHRSLSELLAPSDHSQWARVIQTGGAALREAIDRFSNCPRCTGTGWIHVVGGATRPGRSSYGRSNWPCPACREEEYERARSEYAT